MVRHHAPSEDAHRHSFLNIRQYPLECEVVAVVLKDPAFTVGAIQDVVYEPARRRSEWPWHGSQNAQAAPSCTGVLAPFSRKGS